jgi:hypothetical protein
MKAREQKKTRMMIFRRVEAYVQYYTFLFNSTKPYDPLQTASDANNLCAQVTTY